MPAEYESQRNAGGETHPGFIPPAGLTDAEHDKLYAEYQFVQRVGNPRRTSGERMRMLRGGRTAWADQVRIMRETRRAI